VAQGRSQIFPALENPRSGNQAPGRSVVRATEFLLRCKPFSPFLICSAPNAWSFSVLRSERQRFLFAHLSALEAHRQVLRLSSFCHRSVLFSSSVTAAVSALFSISPFCAVIRVLVGEAVVFLSRRIKG
jgi:hypothetical protein